MSQKQNIIDAFTPTQFLELLKKMNMDAFGRTVVMAAEGAGIRFPRKKRLVKKTKPEAPPVAKQRTKRSLPDWRINKNNPDFQVPSLRGARTAGGAAECRRYQRWYALTRRITICEADVDDYDLETFYRETNNDRGKMRHRPDLRLD